MVTTSLFAGLDVSTQSCKLLIIDNQERAVVYVDSVNYDEDLPHYNTHQGVIQGLGPGISESDPAMWIEAVESVFQRLRESRIPIEAIKCISVSGQQHGLVSLDNSGNLSRQRSKLWNDFSTQEECSLLIEKTGGLDAMIREVGNSQRTGYTASKILHMKRHEPEVFQRTETFLLVHNYINWFLTGGNHGGIAVMEPGDTSGTALWNPATRNWSGVVVASIDRGLMSRLPPVRPSDQPIGTIGPSLVKTYGFDPDCLIDAGSGDNMYGAVGTGNVEPGIITISLGTSGTVYTMLEEPFVDPTGEIASFCDSTGHYLPLLCVSNMANGYEAALSHYGLSHKAFDEAVRRREGNAGCLLVPWFTGERTPDLPQATPVMFGVGLQDLHPDVICRTVLEGHVLNLHEGFTRMKTRPKEIRLTGGLSRSGTWCQMIADVFDAETVPVKGEGAALGAAIHACWVWRKAAGDLEQNLPELAADYIEYDDDNRKRPSEADRMYFTKLKRVFHALSERIQGRDSGDPFTLRAELLREIQ